MSRILVLTMCIIMLFCTTVAAALPQSDFLGGAVNADFYQEESIPSTRAYISYIAAQLLKSGEREPAKTRFTDVPKDEPYSGYIEFLAEQGIIKGYGDGNFKPDGIVNDALASKMALSVLGLSNLADFYGGDNLKAAAKLGFSARAVNSESITIGELHEFFYKAITTEIPEIIYTANNKEVSLNYRDGGGYTYLSKNLGLNIVTGMLISKTRFLVDKSNKYNSISIAEGEQIQVTVNSKIDARNYEHVPATALLDEDGQIIYIKEKNNVVVRYECIYAVNGDAREDIPYAARYIKNIEFVNDENDYDINDKLKLKYNGVITDSACKLAGRVAKVVICDGEITFIESFDFNRGGVITSLSTDEISYDKGNTKNVMREIYKYDDVIVYIDGRSAVLGDLKVGSIFDYYENGKILCISASEKMVVDTLYSMGDKNVEIGGAQYSTDAGCLYFVDGKWQTNGKDLMGIIVRGLFAPNGKLAYIKADNGQTPVFSEFYGIVNGIKEYPMDEGRFEIELWRLDLSGGKEIYQTTKRTVYKGTTPEIIKRSAKKSDGSGLYMFKVGQGGNLTEISAPEPFYGYEGERQCATSFVDSAAMSVSAGNTLYFKDVPITAIYEDNNGFNVKQVNWGVLQGRYCGSEAYMKFFGRGKSFVPEVALLYGKLSTIGSKARKYGIITEKRQIIDETGEEAAQIVVLAGTSKMKYKVSNETAAKIYENAFIAFYDELIFSYDGLALVSDPIDLRGSIDSWGTGFWSGKVEKIDSRMIYFDDGRVSCFHPNQNFFIGVNEENPSARFRGITVDDIQEGDRVFCNYLSDGIRGIIVEG